MAGRAVGRHWAVRVESWRRAHAMAATALFAGSCGAAAAAFGAGVHVGAAVSMLLLGRGLGGLTVAGALVVPLPLGATIPAAVALAAMHGYHTVQASADQVLRQPG